MIFTASGNFSVDIYDVGTHKFVMHGASGLSLQEARSIRDSVPQTNPNHYGVIR